MNPTVEKWTGRWEQLKGQIKRWWGQLTDDDLLRAEGDYERLIGIVRERTGESREAIERKLQE